MVLWFYVQEHPNAQPAVVLILKLLRRRDHGLKSRPTDCEKSGSNLRRLVYKAKHTFCGFSMGSYQYRAGKVYGLCVYQYDGSSRRLNRNCFYVESRNRALVYKAFQRYGIVSVRF